MITLGIETSCDETSVSVTRGGTVLSNAVTSSVHLHKRFGGVVPEIASRYHVEYIIEVLEKALKDSDIRLPDVDLVAVTKGPGLVGALLTGISMAKSISYGLSIPLVGINHILAHLYSAFLNEKGNRPSFPFVGLVVSGGHTALFYCEDTGKEKLLGQTLDDAVGEAYDKVAKILKLGYPGGPVIEKMARRSKEKEINIFPGIGMDKNSLDFSFSGIKTAVLYYVNKLRDKGYGIRDTEICDICYAFQERALDALVEKAFLAAELKRAGSIVIGGGVAANARLREKFSEAAKFSGGIKAYFPRLEYSTDNAAMVGSLGEKLYKKGLRSDLYLSAEPNLKT